jgi:hypothetical protein
LGDSSLFRHFLARSGGLYEAADAVLTGFCCLVAGPQKVTKTTLDRLMELR